jgi:predicted nucleic acid-binding protein
VIAFVDTSILVKLLFDEAGSADAVHRLRGREIAVSALSWAEAHAAFARRRREGTLTATDHAQAVARFAELWNAAIEVALDHAVQDRIPALIDRYPLRGADAAQLASALVLHDAGVSVEFATADPRLSWAAEAERLVVWGADVSRSSAPPPTPPQTG